MRVFKELDEKLLESDFGNAYMWLYRKHNELGEEKFKKWMIDNRVNRLSEKEENKILEDMKKNPQKYEMDFLANLQDLIDALSDDLLPKSKDTRENYW